jgi:hypothetical protein
MMVPTELGVMVVVVVAWGDRVDGGDMAVVATAWDGLLPTVLLGHAQSSSSALTAAW